MTRGAWMCRKEDDALRVWFAARVNEKPFADPERAQKWRLSLASLLFLTVLLSDHLWLCAEAKLKPDELSPRDTDERPAASRGHAPSLHFPPSSLPPNESVTFLWDSAKGLWGQGTCRPDSSSENCFTFDDAKSLCEGLSGVQGMHLNLSDLYLSFCNTYSLLDLFYGLSRVDSLNCSLDMVKDGDVMGCSRCVQAYQRFDQQAQEIYEDFEVMAQKYDTDVYSVRTCMEECKMVYKPWLCSQYFQTTQTNCSNKIPCKQYCLEVQKRCPYILPDNDDLIQGGSPSFVCSGLSDKQESSPGTECCDVRWDFKPDDHSNGTVKRTRPSCHHKTSVTTSAASRLCNSRLKLCILVLVLLQTLCTLTAAQTSSGLDLRGVAPGEDSSTNEE
ncbi:transmembrane protein FAM155A-like [Arapaima gigas]